MKWHAVTPLSFCMTLGLLPPAGAAAQATAPATAPTPQIEVCFVLDTTGSMGGLIEGAKAKIWSIANQIIAAKPTPKLKLALIAYRDRGDDYVTRLFDLTDDIDAVYANLQTFQAAGGGDEPESVNQALHEAVTRLSWSPDRAVLKLIFLVGDCPPHMDYPDDVKYAATCERAVKNDLTINTVQCGDHAATTPVWQDIARRGEGSYAAVGQTGDMRVVATPFDAELATLNAELGRTLVPYGSTERRAGVLTKQAASEVAAAPAAADRLRYTGTAGRTVLGGGDLVDDLQAGRVKLAELKKDELPEAMRDLSEAQRSEFVKKQTEQRTQLQARVDDLLKRREAYLDAEARRTQNADRGSAFDLRVAELIREQARRKGIRYEQPSAAQATP